jgi:ribosomal protein S15P/S13E
MTVEGVQEQINNLQAAISILQQHQKDNNKDCPLSTMPYSHFKKMEKE